MTLAFSYVRFSSKKQEQGDSVNRQEQSIRAYAEAHGLELVDDQKFRDLGCSAYMGRNKKEGALRDFLDAVKDGKVPPDSYLLVENLDRLSREKVLPAFDTFSEISVFRQEAIARMDGLRIGDFGSADNGWHVEVT